MNVIVCIKYTSPPIGMDSLYYANPYDMYALCQAVSLKHLYPDTHITVLSMAPESAIPMLKNAIAIGCDEALLIADRDFAGSDTIATSYVLYKAIEYIGKPDFVFCGEKSIDGETGFTGIALAHRLNYMYISNVINWERLGEKAVIKTENLYYENMVEVQFPALLSFNQLSIHKSAFSLQRQKQANQYTPRILTNTDLKIDTSLCGLKGSLTNVLKVRNAITPNKEKRLIINEVKAGVNYLLKELRA